MRLQGLLYARIGLGTGHGDRVTCNDHYVDMLQVFEIKHLNLLHYDVVTDIKLLQLLEVLLGVQELTVELRKLVPGYIESLKLRNGTKSLKQKLWIDQARVTGELVAA